MTTKTNQVNQVNQVAQATEATLVKEHMRNSFFLPPHMLSNPGYQVAPINIVSGKYFNELYPVLQQQSTVVLEGATLNMLVNSAHVGLSFRCIRATGEKVVLVKVWQGPVSKGIKHAVLKKKQPLQCSKYKVVDGRLSLDDES